MSPRLDRRNFLKLGTFTAVAVALPGCGKSEKSPAEPETVDKVFPQGVASGDPRPDRITLWTRVESTSQTPEMVEVEMALDAAFTQTLNIPNATFPARPEGDYTLKIEMSGLSAHTVYYYRFTARGVTTGAARTVTAPGPDDDVEVNFAFASCQDFIGRYYHSWNAIADQELDFIVHLGDYVYETTGDPRFQQQTGRGIQLPDGMQVDSYRAAQTLADYRALYKQYRSDPMLKKVHARAPFINIWDDHEFSDDCWGDHGTYFNEEPPHGNEEDATRRHVASQAFWEHQLLASAVVFDPNKVFPDDIQIYRSFRFGKHVELFLTDERYYRDDQPIPEGPKGTDIDPTLFYKTAYSSFGSRQFVNKTALDKIEAQKTPTMLGATQKQWLKDGIKNSAATWKVWGSEVQTAQMVVDLTTIVPLFPAKFYVEVDQWDGYRTERAEILGSFKDVPNVVTICGGDIHAFYAAELQADFDNPSDVVAVEFTGAGISSESLQDGIQAIVDGSTTLQQAGLGALVPQMDDVLKSSGPHYKFARSKANGVSLVKVAATEFNVTYVIVPTDAVLKSSFSGSPENVKMRVAAGVKAIEML